MVGSIDGRDPQIVADRVRTLIELAAEQRFPDYAAMGRMHVGSRAIEEGRLEEGIRLIEESRAGVIATSAGAGAALTLAGAYAKLGRLDDACRLLAAARARVERTGEQATVPMIEGVASTLAMFSGDSAGAQARLRQGLDISRRLKMKLAELRFAVGLARLASGRDEKEEGRRILEEVYDWFTEGFDTPMLKEARSLLDQLGSP